MKIYRWRFDPNTYKKYFINNTMDGKQLTVLWHIYYINISHIDTNVVDSVLGLPEE